MTSRDASYVRISEDDLGTERGVKRQGADCKKLSAARGGRIVAAFCDNDLSALKGGNRPDYERLMAMVDAGLVDRIIVFQTSRLWRNRKERAEGIERLCTAGVSVLAVKGPELDLTTASGRMMAGILGEFDTAESEIKGERVARAALERAQDGRANGVVLYGWQRAYEHDDKGRVVGFRDVEDPAEAAIVREIVDRVLAGHPLRAITRDLNERGVPAPRAGDNRKHRAKDQDEQGTKWGKTSVKKLAIRPANVALRVYHRGRPDEAMLPGAWPALVSQDDHDRVVALLSGNTGPKVDRPGARVHLATWGVGECGVCYAHLRMAVRGNSRYGKRKPCYVCSADGCVGRVLAYVDELIKKVVVERLSRADAVDLVIGDDSAMRDALNRAEAIRARLAQAADDLADERITRDQMLRITAKLRPQLADAEAQARALRRDPHAGLVLDAIGKDAEKQWESYTVAQRHAMLGVLFDWIRIMPTRRGPGFDPKSVKFKWRGSDQEADSTDDLAEAA